jgi:hypothetical protein
MRNRVGVDSEALHLFPDHQRAVPSVNTGDARTALTDVEVRRIRFDRVYPVSHGGCVDCLKGVPFFKRPVDSSGYSVSEPPGQKNPSVNTVEKPDTQSFICHR